VKNNRQVPTNCIEDCISQANSLNREIDMQPGICQIFKKLARDEITGLMAYTIWRTRSNFYSKQTCASGYKRSEANASRVSQARTCWHIGSVALSDLSRSRRPVR
jgi:hypothetical protein